MDNENSEKEITANEFQFHETNLKIFAEKINE